MEYFILSTLTLVFLLNLRLYSFWYVFLNRKIEKNGSIFWRGNIDYFENSCAGWTVFPSLYGNFRETNCFFHPNRLELLPFRCSDYSTTLHWHIWVWNESLQKNFFLRFFLKSTVFLFPPNTYKQCIFTPIWFLFC